ncbi:MAG: diheme cytochrome c [Devosiaceae bacterium]|nr:diheme cytochrome c [Devosiaceae bacterium]
MKNNKLLISLLSLPLLATPFVAIADDDNVPPIKSLIVLEECGACHLAFQPAFLPKKSWQKMMGELENHFGEDASLDADSIAKIENYLVANASRKKFRGDKAPQRITELRWFTHEHSEREAKNMMKKLKVKSLVDCAACHKGAEMGIYDDD